jgi:hypothetical protein|tara:strand:- start:28458 stop:28667 length:210 start_codon:yes stop_codon:yes gene_type:complete
VAAIVVHARLRKMRLSEVDQEESMGMARRDAIGVNGARRAERDIVVDSCTSMNKFTGSIVEICVGVFCA